MIQTTTTELTDESYWSGLWSDTQAAYQPIDPISDQDREYHQFFSAALAGRSGRLLEVGCGSSRWLPYFAQELGWEVCGIDYSELGCRYAAAILDRSGVNGTVLQRNALEENGDLVERFDAVVSLGVIEHFADTAAILRSLARYVKPDGLILSTSPNMAGVLGAAQHFLNPEVYAGHVRLTLEQLAGAHREAGLQVREARHIGSLDFHVLNLHGVAARSKWLAYKVLMRLSRIGWRTPFSLPRTRWSSSGIAVSAAKPAR